MTIMRGVVLPQAIRVSANAPCVADHAMALLLALLRDLRGTDAVIRVGGWRVGEATRPTATGRRVGILGLGDIG